MLVTFVHAQTKQQSSRTRAKSLAQHLFAPILAEKARLWPQGHQRSLLTDSLKKSSPLVEQMKMESAVEEAQQGVEAAATEPASQQITPAQIAALAQVSHDRQPHSNNLIPSSQH